MTKIISFAISLTLLYYGAKWLVDAPKRHNINDYIAYKALQIRDIEHECININLRKEICGMYIQAVDAEMWFELSKMFKTFHDKKFALAESKTLIRKLNMQAKGLRENRGNNFIITELKKDKHVCTLLKNFFKDIDERKLKCEDSKSTMRSTSGVLSDLHFFFSLGLKRSDFGKFFGF